MTSIKKLFALDNPFRLAYHKMRAILANIIYGFPSKNMIIIGVTGTNGKTTTSNIIAKGLKEAGKKIFMFTTVNIIIGDKEYVNDTKMTSPDVFLLQRLFKQAKDEGCEIAVIETASHGIKMSRVWGLDYDIAVLTNITQDHLDLHRTMKDYVNTKLSLFKNLITYNRKPGIKKTAVINVGSEYSELFVAETYDSVYLYGKGNGASLVASNIRIENTFTKFDVKLPGKTITIETKLKGDFNIENILAAIGVFMSFSIPSNKIIDIIKNISGVPGRMELVENDLEADIFVDYAHTPDALEKVLTTLKDIGYNKIITVFGATGDRDKTKRPIMGEIVSKYSDIVILTQDDDYTENTEKIIKDVLPGINRIEGNDFFVIPSRKEAIEVAITSLEKGDALLVAGKGDEHVIVTNAGPLEWHDRTVIKQILKDIDDNKIIV
ncbi:MAG: UDP-N-acetylmuramoyl-L-alanyl-D-glutamate--2,6-diaminopimelate ligase [Candidatus Gracilibacteria bacterium]|nr:UDP-N-acetylmuramoyl-L-alanyl-D-glutamate--2,6-diaminopimelate ligase [Candidatus Gracilibacteria bacterium]